MCRISSSIFLSYSKPDLGGWQIFNLIVRCPFQKAHILVALNVLFQNMYKAYMNRAYLTQFWSDYLKP